MIFKLFASVFCSRKNEHRRSNKSSSSFAVGCCLPSQKIIIPEDKKPAKGSGFESPIKIDDGVVVLRGKEENRGRITRVSSISSSSHKRVMEIGESSRSAFQDEKEMVDSQFSSSSQKHDFVCEICMESKHSCELFSIQGCSHTYCMSCLNQYVASKVEINMLLIKCPCPDCANGKLEPTMCSSFLEDGLFDRWCMALCESMVVDKFYCPFKDCSALMINDTKNVITEAKCFHCNRLFCAQCKVEWHAGFSCSKFQKFGKEEKQNNLKLLKLAKKRKWQRCPNCKYFVERICGCKYINCRCGITFCYLCASKQLSDHYCTTCKS